MIPTKTVPDWRSPATPTSLTVMRPASATGISRRMISPISRLRSWRTRWCRSDCIGLAESFNQAARPNPKTAAAKRPSSSLQFLRHFFQGVTFDHVSDLEIIEAIQADAAFHPGADFVDFILETSQRQGDALIDKALAALDAHFAFDDAAVGDDAPGNVAALGEREDLAHFGGADDDLPDQRVQQAGHRFLHFVDEFVNDRVEFDLDSFTLGQIGHAVVHAGVESENDGFHGRGQEHIGFGYGTDGAVDDVQSDLGRLDLFQCLDDRFDRALGVRLDDHLEHLARFRRQGIEQVFQRDLGAAILVFAAEFFDALLGQDSRVFFVLDHAEFQACFRNAVQAKHLNGDRRHGVLEPFAFLVDQGADFAPELSANDHVAHAQRPFAHQDGGRWSAGFEARFDDVAFGGSIGVGFEFQDFGLEYDHFEQLVDSLLGEGRDVHKDGVAAPFLADQPFVLQLLADFHRVCVGMVGLVDCDDDGDLGGLGVAESLEGLGDDRVVGGDHQHHDVGDVGATGAH